MDERSEPGIKASHFGAQFRALSALGSAEAEARRRLAPLQEAFASTSRADFVPIAWDIEFAQVLFEVGGVEAIHAMNRAMFAETVGGALLGPLFRGAANVFGLSPKGMLKVVTRGWEAASRHLGSLRVVENDDGRAVLQLLDVPAALHGNQLWGEGQVGLFQGICDFTRHRCTGARVTYPSPAVHRYEFLWENRPSP